MWCHFLLALPVLGLTLFGILPVQYALPAYLALNLPALGIYYLITRALHAPVQAGVESLIHAEGDVVAVYPGNALANCLVRCQGEAWTAYALDPVAVGTRVRIVGFEGTRPTVVAAEGLARPSRRSCNLMRS